MEEIVARWQSGDERAFDELFEKLKGLVFKNALLITGDPKEAEEILQEVFVRVWKSGGTFDAGRGDFLSWLYKITVNNSISHHRKKDPQSSCLLEEDITCVDRKESVEEKVDSQWEYEQVRQIVDGMKEKYRLVLILKYYDDLPNAEIARILDIPLGTVKSRLHNAITVLKRKWAEFEQENCLSEYEK